MTKRTALTSAPPYAVEQVLKRLGSNLRTARLRRNQSINDVARKIGTGNRAVMDAERGKPGTGAAVYFALLWAYDLLRHMSDVADPAKDEEGMALSGSRVRARARAKGRLSNDF